jgi:hypothetical protein
MGTASKKPRAMKSAKSGVKTQKRLIKNNEILKKLLKEIK